MPSAPLMVAVTGGIGAGKSTVSAALAARGAVVIDADRLAREVVAPGTAGLAAVAEAFGPGVLAGDGSLDRAAMGRIVFVDRAALARLEAITHPLVRALTAERVAGVPADGIAVNDIPLIRAMPDAAHYHLVIGVGIADPATRVQRLIARGHTEADARARIAAQISDDERRALADVWLDNSAGINDLEPAIIVLWDRLTTFAAHRRAGSVPAARRTPVRPGLSSLDTKPLTVARVSKACGGRVPEVLGAAGQAGLTMTVALQDRAAIDLLRPTLLDAGFPALDPGRGSEVNSEVDMAGSRFGSADPGVSLNLYLTVKD